MASNNVDQNLHEQLSGVEIAGDDSLKELVENTGYLREDLNELITAIETELPEVEKRKADTKVKIVQLMHEIRTRIEDRERELLKQNENEFNASLNELKLGLAASKTLAKEVDDLATKANDALKYGAVDGDQAPLEREFRLAQTKYFDTQDRLTCPELTVLKHDEGSLKGLRFAEFHSQSLIGKNGVDDEQDDGTADAYVPDFDFCCKTPRDVRDPFITAIAWINKKIVIADKANRKVKFFLENEDFLHEMIFSVGEPYGVCFVQMGLASQIETYAVTLPKVKMLYFICIPTNAMTQPVVKNYIKTNIGYSGISSLGAQLIVSAVNIDYPRIDVMDHNGYVLKSFAMDSNQRPLFSFPRYVSIDVSVCIVSDWKQHKMTVLRGQDGVIFGAYYGTHEHPLREPYGVANDGKGYIFIMDGATGTIHVVDRNYRFVTLIEETKTLSAPRILAHDVRSGYLAVSYAVSNVKCIPAPSAVPKYENVAENNESRVSGVPDDTRLPVPEGSNFRCPSPGF